MFKIALIFCAICFVIIVKILTNELSKKRKTKQWERSDDLTIYTAYAHVSHDKECEFRRMKRIERELNGHDGRVIHAGIVKFEYAFIFNGGYLMVCTNLGRTKILKVD